MSGERSTGEPAPPQVSVVVPVRDEEEAVAACVSACLAQTLVPAELVVVDNGSSDDTARRAEDAGATVLSEPVAGSYRARNTGWRATTAPIVAFTDGDCVPDPTWLAELVAGFGDPSVTGVGGRIVQAELNSATQRWIVERKFLDQEFNAAGQFLPFLATANAAYRRSALEAAGGFDTVFRSGGDNDLSWRLQALHGGRIVYRPEATVQHLVGEGLSEITGRWRRYSCDVVLLERRWSGWPGYPEVPGFLTRTRRVWELPLAVANRAVTRRPLSVPFIDAAAAISSEIGRMGGRRRRRASGVEPLRAGDGADQAAPASRGRR